MNPTCRLDGPRNAYQHCIGSVAALGAVVGYVLNNITKKIDRVDAELGSTQRKQDAAREVDRIDRDITAAGTPARD